MPCRCDGYPTELELAQKELDKLTDLLCTLCNQCEYYNFEIDNKVLDWWEKHKEADAKRLAKEKAEREAKLLKKKALAKLSAAERKVLGL